MSNKFINYIGVFKAGLHPMRYKGIKGAADGKAPLHIQAAVQSRREDQPSGMRIAAHLLQIRRQKWYQKQKPIEKSLDLWYNPQRRTAPAQHTPGGAVQAHRKDSDTVYEKSNH